MELKNILCLLLVSFLLFGTVCAQKNVNDFQVDESYGSAHNGTYAAVYLNEKQDSGITVYKYLDNPADDDDDAYDDLIHDDGKDYLFSDDDMKVDKNQDNTVNFTDYDHAQHGVGEMIKVDGEDFVVVCWAKDSSNIGNADLLSHLNEFNKDNNVKATTF